MTLSRLSRLKLAIAPLLAMLCLAFALSPADAQDYTTGLLLRLKSTDAGSLSNGANITSVTPTTGPTLTPAVSGSDPTYVTNAFGTAPGIHLTVDGTGHGEALDTTALSSSAGSYTIIAVVKKDSAGATTAFFDVSSDRLLLTDNLPNPGTGYYAGSGFLQGGTGITNTTSHVMAWVFDAGAGTGTVYDNGVQVFQGAYSARNINGGATVAIGGSTDTNPNTLTGTLGELRLYSGALSTPNLSGASSALATTYNVTSFGAGSPATSFSQTLSGSSGAIGSAVTITYTPNGTSSATVTPAVSGVAGAFSPTTIAFDGTNAAKTVTFTPSAAGTATLSATNSGSLTNPASQNYTVVSGINVLPNNSGLLYSPYNWLVGSSSAKTINSGAYFRTILNSTATCVINLGIGTATPYSQCYARIDQGPWQHYTPSAAGAQTWTLTMPSPTASTHHLLEFVVKSTTQSQDRWLSQLTAVQFAGLTLDSGATASLPNARKYRILIFGDSITEGVLTNGSTGIANDTDQNDVLGDYSYALGGLLDAEIGVVGFGSSGLSVAGSGNVPALVSAYNLLWQGQARSFAVVPDLVIYNEGSNEGGTNITSQLTAVVNGIGDSGTANTYAGFNGTRHLVLEPFGAYNASQLQAAVTSIGNANVTYASTAGLYSGSDGLHPLAYTHLGLLAPGVAALAMPVLHPASAGTSGPKRRLQ